MSLHLLFFGRKSDIVPQEEEYVRRIGFRCPMDLQVLPQAGVKETPEVIKRLEAEKLLPKLAPEDFVVALDERGKTMDTPTFTSWLKDRLESPQKTTFVLGGAYGLDAKILTRANLTLRLSDMVYTKDLARLMLLEQIYRGVEKESFGK